MNSLVDTIEYRGCTIEVHYDSDTENPVDKLKYDPAIIWAVWERNSIFSDRDYRPVDEPSEMPAWAEENGFELFPLFKYEHSGVAYSISNSSYPFNCPWDAGRVGYIAVKKDAGFNAPLAEVAETYVNTIGAWCNGECYGYICKDEDDEYIDSCWGFIGDDRDDYMLGQAKEAIDYHLKDKAELPSRYQEVADAALNQS